jgi:aldehyde:ferredoxin oxidoreductase
MKDFKFFQKEIRKFNVYEKMVLNMVDYCRNNAIVYKGYTHSFVITEITGIKHKRIVLTNIIKHQNNILIDYNIHLTNNHPNDSVSSHTLEITEHEYNELTEMNCF